MRILVPGGEGLVGRALSACGSARGHEVWCPGRAECDVTDEALREEILRSFRPDAVIFCAAITDVDGCADQPAAPMVNVEAPAAWAARVPTWFLSSNFVFDGHGPHPPDGAPTPRGVYARQKAEAERRVLTAGGHVARVGWVYGPGGRTFASRLAARLRAGEAVRAVADVVVQPTWSRDLAESLLELPPGVSHHIGSGEASWYGFALHVWARVGAGSVVPVRMAELGLREPRPRDARLIPAKLAPWWERVEEASRL
jgi:dTDP-4-dehydrorhamnose reductase